MLSMVLVLGVSYSLPICISFSPKLSNKIALFIAPDMEQCGARRIKRDMDETIPYSRTRFDELSWDEIGRGRGHIGRWSVHYVDGRKGVIDFAYRGNTYYKNTPIYARTEDGTWFKFEIPPTQFVLYVTQLPIYDGEDDLELCERDAREMIPAPEYYTDEYKYRVNKTATHPWLRKILVNMPFNGTKSPLLLDATNNTPKYRCNEKGQAVSSPELPYRIAEDHQLLCGIDEHKNGTWYYRGRSIELNKLIYTHHSNTYRLHSPVYFCGDTGEWFKCEDPSLELNIYLCHLPEYNGTEGLQLSKSEAIEVLGPKDISESYQCSPPAFTLEDMVTLINNKVVSERYLENDKSPYRNINFQKLSSLIQGNSTLWYITDRHDVLRKIVYQFSGNKYHFKVPYYFRADDSFWYKFGEKFPPLIKYLSDLPKYSGEGDLALSENDISMMKGPHHFDEAYRQRLNKSEHPFARLMLRNMPKKNLLYKDILSED